MVIDFPGRPWEPDGDLVGRLGPAPLPEPTPVADVVDLAALAGARRGRSA